MRKLDKPVKVINKSLWVHPSQNEEYLSQDFKNGFFLFSDKRMVRFDSKDEAKIKGWKEEDRLTVIGVL